MQKTLCNSFDSLIEIKTDCIGDYKFRCHVNLIETKNMENINVHYPNARAGTKFDIQFAVNFLNGFNVTLNLNAEYRGSDNKIMNSLKLKSPPKLTLEPLQAISIEG